VRFGMRASFSILVISEHHVPRLTYKLAQHVCSCFVFSTEHCMLRGLLWFLMLTKRASTHPLVDLWAGRGHVIAGLLEPVGDSSEGYF